MCDRGELGYSRYVIYKSLDDSRFTTLEKDYQ